jgi:hypothetical protein
MLPKLANEFLNLRNENFDKPRTKSILFLGTYVLAMLITLIVIGISNHPIVILYLVLLFPVSIMKFPMGLISILTQQFGYIPHEIPLTLIVILGYLGISLPAIFIKSRWVFKFLYLIFIVFLIMNIVGCSISFPINMSSFN